MADGTLQISRSVVLDGSGQGVVRFVTDNANQSWTVKGVSVYTANTNPPVPVASVYLGYETSAGGRQGAAWSGNRANAITNISVGECDVLTVQWTGGNPGDIATVVLSGTSATRGRP